MKIKYDRESDVLIIHLSGQHPDFAEQQDNFITHYSKKGVPVEIEVLDARRTAKKMLAVIESSQ